MDLIKIFKYIFLLLVGFFIFSSRPSYALTNLIANPSVENSSGNPLQPVNWFHDGYGTNTVVYQYPLSGFQSSQAIGINMTSWQSGDAKWFFQNIPVTPGRQYRYADYYISTLPSDISIRYTKTDGTYFYSWLATLPPASTWTRTEKTFTVPDNVVSLTVFHLIYGVGNITLDNFSLEWLGEPVPTPSPTSIPTTNPTSTPTSAPTPTTISPTPTNTPSPTSIPTPTPTPTPANNLIANPSLETTSNGRPQGWRGEKWGNNNAVFTYPVAGYLSPKAAQIDITQFTDGDAKWYFTEVPVTPGHIYTFSNTYKTNAKNEISLRYKNTSGNYVFEYSTMAEISPDWNNLSHTFIVPPNMVSLTVYHSLVGQGYLAVDNFSLRDTNQESRFTQGMVSIDFDDGAISSLTTAIPILNNANIKSTNYLVTGNLGKGGYITSAQAQQIQNWGHEIQDHTQNHLSLIELPSSQDVINEISQARTILRSYGLSPITAIAFPFGDYDSSTISIVRQQGFLASRTTDRGFNFKNSNPYTLKSYSLERTETFNQIKSYIDQTVRDRTWLILVFHQVDDTSFQFSTSPSKFQQIVDYLKNNNIEVVTLSQGLARMSR